LPAGWGKWALSEGWPEATIRIQADTFADFWRSKAGKDAAKLDWEATWRNWMRKVPKIARSHNGAPPQREQSMAEFMRQRLERANNEQHIFDAECENGAGSNTNIHFLAAPARH
jgi:hypothetical protein